MKAQDIIDLIWAACHAVEIGLLLGVVGLLNDIKKDKPAN